jgi:hypothetical protein
MKTVRYSSETLPNLAQEDWDRIDAVKDEDIDYSDIPQVTDFSKLRLREPREAFRLAKIAVACKLAHTQRRG